MEGNRLPSDFQQSAQAEEEIDDMGYSKADEIPGNSISREQHIQKENIQGVGEDVIAYTSFLLAQALDHGVGYGIAVKHDG